MSRQDKLIAKLKNGSISSSELRTLLKQMRWVLGRTNGSHEIWKSGSKRFVLATHTNDLKDYQIRDAIKELEV
jgi:predicted RNA binding protein YcfA (HicA-like mRNA interferase family)